MSGLTCRSSCFLSSLGHCFTIDSLLLGRLSLFFSLFPFLFPFILCLRYAVNSREWLLLCICGVPNTIRPQSQSAKIN